MIKGEVKHVEDKTKGRVDEVVLETPASCNNRMCQRIDHECAYEAQQIELFTEARTGPYVSANNNEFYQHEASRSPAAK